MSQIELLLMVNDLIEDLGQDEAARACQLAIDKLDAIVEALHFQDDVHLSKRNLSTMMCNQS